MLFGIRLCSWSVPPRCSSYLSDGRGKTLVAFDGFAVVIDWNPIVIGLDLGLPFQEILFVIEDFRFVVLDQVDFHAPLPRLSSSPGSPWPPRPRLRRK